MTTSTERAGKAGIVQGATHAAAPVCTAAGPNPAAPANGDSGASLTPFWREFVSDWSAYVDRQFGAAR